MTTRLEDQLREVLRDAPEPDWRALRAGVEDRAARQRRTRMLRGSLGGCAAAAAVAVIAVTAASSPVFNGSNASGLRPAGSGTSTASTSPSPEVPARTEFQPRLKLANGDYRLPMAFPDVAPTGADAPEGTERSATATVFPEATVGSAQCLYSDEAPSPKPWGSTWWDYRPPGEPDGWPTVRVTLVGWPAGSAVEGMQQLAQNSGACTFDQLFSTREWPGLAATEGNQFVIEDPRVDGGRRSVAIRRVGDVTVDARVMGADADVALETARGLVDKAVAGLLTSKVLDDPQPSVFAWPDGVSEMATEPAHFILPAIEPAAGVVGVKGFTRTETFMNSDLRTVPALGAHVGDPAHPGERPVAGRTADYELEVPEATESGGKLTTTVRWMSFRDGRKAFDEIVADRGTARWFDSVAREQWSGHDDATTFLATLSGQPRPTQVALRLEGDVLISVVAKGEDRAQARTIATKLADQAATNLAAFGRGPDGRPGNGR